MGVDIDPATCRELQRKARRWAEEAGNRRDRRLAERLLEEFRALQRRLRRRPPGPGERDSG